MYQIQKVDFLPVKLPPKGKSAPKKKLGPQSKLNYVFQRDKDYIHMLKSLFAKSFFYFSYDYDLTQSLNKLLENGFDRSQMRSEYFFNEALLHSIIALNVKNWVLPVISGVIEESHGLLKNKEYDLLVISRREKSRSGMRFISRGLDQNGNASNFAETEQIFIINEYVEARVFSFTQIRGSIPLDWHQKPNLQWEPPVLLRTEREKNVELARKHLDHLAKNYSQIVLISLIDKKKNQKIIGEELTYAINRIQNPKIQYIWFDFHHECRKGKYQNLSKLVDCIGETMNNIGYSEYVIQKNKGDQVSTIKQQKGTYRTNCMDCLDRTNVVQSVLSRLVLQKFLTDIGAFDAASKNATEVFRRFDGQLEDQFRSQWTRNANVLSLLYTGTGALKTDFTQTGKRTKKGALEDGKRSLTRYVLNNFYDGHNQNAIDFLLGKIKPREVNFSPKINKFIFALILMIVIPLVVYEANNLFVGRIVTQNPEVPVWKQGLLSLIFIGLSMFSLISFIFSKDTRFIQKPVIND
eukprot:TRINITY_DN5169_c0_g1_i2.p1 TRINITY_DN5169_c0_g1~~TRINITY_DN5169_c0_g1_i2.p1  ORF type:complete len:522 (+),score=125.56 TRINITY_DN5169_c0_g1_i2:180-1745(+)